MTADRVLLGKVAWDAMADRDERGAPAAIVRVEQLYPLPTEQMLAVLEQLPERPRAGVAAGGAREHGRVEVHREQHLADQGAGLRHRHVARVESGSPATGSKTVHDQELADLLDEAFATATP